MLSQLIINNIALISNLVIDFGPGMNSLTGETGAGKTIIIDSISCLLGGRVGKEIIKRDCNSGSVQGLFYAPDINDVLAELDIPCEDDGSVVLFREISSDGRNKCRVNGRIVTLSGLKSVGERLVDIHGQHHNQSLMRTESHIGLLDSYGGADISDCLNEYKNLLGKMAENIKLLKSLSGDPSQRMQLMDLLTYQINEIRNSGIYPGEDNILRERRTVLANSEKITSALTGAYEGVTGQEYGEGSLYDMLNTVKTEIEPIASYSPKYGEILKQIYDLEYALDDLKESIRKEKDSVEYDPLEAEQISLRLDYLSMLKRKYASAGDGDLGRVLDFCAEAERKLEDMSGSEERYTLCLAQIASQQSELKSICDKLHDLRLRAASNLNRDVCEELKDLNMAKSRFCVAFEYNDATKDGYYNFGKDGLDGVEFLISANPGEPLKPLAKIASGGELSRIMLAIKTILAEIDNVPTLIFDEIDTGISGQAAVKVGEKMSQIAQKHQVICVTHHPQIAAMANHNIYISKKFENDKTVVSGTILGEREKISEIARLLDGDGENEITLQHAKSMIKKYLPN